MSGTVTGYLVYKVRGRAAGKTDAKTAAPKPVAGRRAAPAASPKPDAARQPEAANGHASAPEILRALAAEIGLGRAIEILHEQRSAVLRVLRA